MGKLQVSELGAVRKALSEAARTDDSSASRIVARFIELRPGIADKLGARRHHLLTGRRGTGKSTLLQVVRSRLINEGVAVATVDMERFKGREFPDVLIEILLVLMEEIRPKIRLWHAWPDLRLRRKVTRVKLELRRALADPQSVLRSLERRATSEAGAGAKGGLLARYKGVGLAVDASASKSATTVSATSAAFEEMKIERLQQLAPSIAGLFSALVARSNGSQALIFIDDYYFVRLDDQPAVLAYLHQVCKGTGVWLKIGGVGSRLRPFSDGDPQVGMQPGQDLDKLALDVTLDDFATAKRFLEEVLDGVLAGCGVTTVELFSATARDRMVLACGGAVARDYITLTDAALDEAIERMSKRGPYASGDIVAVESGDVHRAVRKRLNTKEEELGFDAGSDAPLLRDRWRDICDFTREASRNAFVLVKQSDLDGTDWGKEIQQLENLRLLHRIKDTVPNTPAWRGVKTMAFMVDLAQVADQRLRTSIPEFWKSTAEFDRLRRAEWVYDPAWRETQAKKK